MEQFGFIKGFILVNYLSWWFASWRCSKI